MMPRTTVALFVVAALASSGCIEATAAFALRPTLAAVFAF